MFCLNLIYDIDFFVPFIPDAVTHADSFWNGEITEGQKCCQGHRTSFKHPGLRTALISLRGVSPIQHVCMWLDLAHTHMQSDTDKTPDLAGGKDAVSCRITETHNRLASVFAE